MISIKMVSVIATLTGLLLGVLSIVVSVLNRKRFSEICILYKKNMAAFLMPSCCSKTSTRFTST